MIRLAKRLAWIAAPAAALALTACTVPNAGDVEFVSAQYPHPTISVIERTPPEVTIIRVTLHARTIHEPQSFEMVVKLYKYHLTPDLRWVPAEIRPPEYLSKAQLPIPGDGWQAFHFNWTCRTGRYYVKFNAYGRTHTGQYQNITYYWPYKAGSSGTKAPTLSQSARITHC